MAPTRGSAPATGWWSRPTRATAASCACRRSSPIVTNMDPEHLDHWGTPEAMVAGYDQFVGNVPFYGFAVLCIDHPAVQQMIPRLSDRRIITYGFSPQADVRAERVVPDKLGSTFDVTVTDRARNRSRKLGPYRLPMLGAAQRAERAGGGGGRRRDGDRRRHAAQRVRRVPWREAPLHQDRRGRRHHRDRRLRPPSGGDRRGAEGGAAGRRARRDRGGAAASLHAACIRCSTSSAPA